MKNTVTLCLDIDNGLTHTKIDIDNSCNCKDLTVTQRPIFKKVVDSEPRKPAPPKKFDIRLLEEEQKIIINGVVLEGAILAVFKDFLNQ